MSAERKPGMKSEAELEQALCQLLNEIPDPNRGGRKRRKPIRSGW